MKKQILNEVNRTREIMGLKPLLLEQATLLALFRKLLKNTSAIEAFGEVLQKKFGKLPETGIPITTIGRSRELVPIMLEMMQNTKTVVRSNGQLLKSKLALNGVDITESQARTLATAWKQGDDVFTNALETLGRVGGDFDSIAAIISRETLSEIQKPLADAVEKVMTKLKVSNMDDLGKLLKKIEMDEDTIQAILKNLNEFGTIGSGDKLEKIFGKLVRHPDYQAGVIKTLQNSKDFQKLVRLKGDGKFSKENLAKSMGLDADDPLVKLIYGTVILPTKNERWIARWGKVWGVLTKTPVGKGIMYYFYITLGMNLLYEAMYGLKGKGKAGITPKVYTDVMGSKEFVKRGGLTNAEATEIAKRINTAIYEWGALASSDNKIKDIYNNEIDSILAASQVSYFYEKLPETSGTLEKALNRLNIEITPKQFNLPDFTIEDVVDILETKPWVDQVGVTTTKKFKEVLKKNWPRYRVTLNSNDGGEWHTRKTGPIDGLLLAALLEGCTDSEEDCLDNMTPEDFNAIMSTVFQNPPVMYTETKPANTEAEDEETFFDSWVEVLDDQSKASEIFKDVKNMAN